MNVTDIADEIYRELDQAPNISIPTISFWLLSNIGKLNTLLGLTIGVVSAQFDTDITDSQKNIFKLLYFIQFYQRQATNSLGAAAFDSVVEVEEGNRRVRKISKNEVAKTYMQMKKSANEELIALVNAYKIAQMVPVDVNVKTDFGSAVPYDDFIYPDAPLYWIGRDPERW